MKRIKQDMNAIAQTLAQILLEHHRNNCRSASTHATLSDKDVKSKLIFYGDLRAKAGVRFPAMGFGRPLCIIAEWCRRNGWPPINSLVVAKNTGEPGEKYSHAPGCGAKWKTDVRRCITWKQYPTKVENWLS